MTGAGAHCSDDRRRSEIRASERLNGIDFVEVRTEAAGTIKLDVHLLRSLPSEGEGELFGLGNVRIEGVGRDATIGAVDLAFVRGGSPERDDKAVLTLDAAGDAGLYSLCLVPDEDQPLLHLDPRYCTARFRFVPESPSDIDCLRPSSPPAPLSEGPDLNYLAKDYASFRQLLLDRLAITVPDWQERHTPDLFLTLVELLAYEADQLSYAQDAVGTEAYLDTARLRTSVRRHARLVDYRMHEGCNARTWVCLRVTGNPSVRAQAISFLTRPEGVGTGRAGEGAEVRTPDLRTAPRSSYEVFEVLSAPASRVIREQDIVGPDEVAENIRSGDSPLMRYIRGRLTPELLEQLDVKYSPAEVLPNLLALLAGLLTDLLTDPGLTTVDPHAMGGALRLYGTPNGLQGSALRRHNRRFLEDELAGALAPEDWLSFHQAHNTIHFYTWGNAECCLPRGTTSATLLDGRARAGARGRLLEHLRVGDVLLLEEIVNARSGSSADVDPGNRHPVRLTRVEPGRDLLRDTLVVEVSWDAADALPFPLVLSAIGPAPECALLTDLAVAHGNAVLVDHGETVREPTPVDLQGSGRTIVTVPFPEPHRTVPVGDIDLCCSGETSSVDRASRPVAYEPVTAQGPLVFAQVAPRNGPARTALSQDPAAARPQIALFSPLTRPHPRLDVFERPADEGSRRPPQLYERWAPQLDLLSSDPDDRSFVVEVDDDGAARLRFGDDVQGAQPSPGTELLAWYRVGGGTRGNVGQSAIRRVVLHGGVHGRGAIAGVRNPLPAQGGRDPEPVERVRLLAPHAFRSHLQRAIISEDYAQIALREFPGSVHHAAARMDIIGPRTVVTVFVDPQGTTADDSGLRDRIRDRLEVYRCLGHELQVHQANYVPVALELTIGFRPHHREGAVRQSLLARFGHGLQADGGHAFFHPDVMTFGQRIAVSSVVTAAHAVPGVAWVAVDRLARLDDGINVAADPATQGLLRIEPHEIARLEHDPDFPQHGTLTIHLEVTS